MSMRLHLRFHLPLELFATRLPMSCCAAAAIVFLNPCPALADEDHEDSTAKYQLTYNTQYHPAFNSNGSTSYNSLTAGSDKMFTFTTTAHWGWRVWEGGEFYINPEIASGVPFSQNLVGMGSFTNGEITRAAGAKPQPYLQRIFLRQTWNQGGGTEHLDSDFNQMAGNVDKNRWVLTVGNFSTLDVMDDNSYAKDPRTQFMNWGSWTYAAYDYAADARGYGWGAALEYHRGDWSYRIARMTGPKSPNGLPIDFNINKHHGDQIEVERRHQIDGQPGSVRVLAFHNRAVMASYADATALLYQTGPNQQTILQVRNGEKSRTGLGINFEQAINANTGVFARLMNTDGKTETLAFTEVDTSLAAGAVMKGAAWSQPEDSAGLVYMRNGLSAERRAYLAAGGISYFIGDGLGNSPWAYKPESIIEGFYSRAITKTNWITLDYQRVNNPAYNANRGPVDVYALRWHSEF
jgi:hypothetical protein